MFIGDIHEGNIGCCPKPRARVIKYVRNTPYTFWIAIGDILYGIVPSDNKRFDIRMIDYKYRDVLDDIVAAQIDTTVKRFKPIANKCLGWHRGNHEESIRRDYHKDVLKEINKRLGVRLYYDMAVTRLRFYVENNRWSNSFDILTAHGNVAGRKSGGKVNRLVDLMADFEANVYALGHGHSRETAPKTKLYFDQVGEIRDREVSGTYTGSFLKAYVKGETGYAEKAMYPPNSIGTVQYRINPKLNKIEHGLL